VTDFTAAGRPVRHRRLRQRDERQVAHSEAGNYWLRGGACGLRYHGGELQRPDKILLDVTPSVLAVSPIPAYAALFQMADCPSGTMPTERYECSLTRKRAWSSRDPPPQGAPRGGAHFGRVGPALDRHEEMHPLTDRKTIYSLRAAPS
jgi:hypothetical protein